MCPLRLRDKFYHKLTHRLSAHGRYSQAPGPYMGLVFVKNAGEKRANGLQKVLEAYVDKIAADQPAQKCAG